MPSKKSVVKSAVGTQVVKAAAKKKPANAAIRRRVAIELALGKDQNLADLQKKKQGLMLFIDAPMLKESSWKDLAQFLRSAGANVIGICDSCSIVPPPLARPARKKPGKKP